MVAEASILVIDDEPSTAEAMQPVLPTGYRLEFARPRELSPHLLRGDHPDVLLLNISRRRDDWSYYRQLVVLLRAPLLILLDPDREPPQAPGLDPSHLPARVLYLIQHGMRIRTLLKAIPNTVRRRAPLFFVDAELAVDLVREEVWRSGDPIRLTRTEFRLLTAFLQHPGSLLDYATLLEQVWGPNHRRGPQALRPHIHSLRRKLEPHPARPMRIVTHRGKGYIFRRLQER